jgi:hypothetical protein
MLGKLLGTRKVRSVLALLCLTQLLFPAALLANPLPVNLDLSSTARSAPAAQVANFQPTAINVGGTTVPVTATTALTPAESLAVAQMLNTGMQSVALSLTGAAIGGSVSLSSQFAQFVADLVIPHGVTAITEFNTSPNFNIAGNLNNSGALYALSSNPQITQANFYADNIVNHHGALISTVLPTNGLPGALNAVPNLSLSLNAVNNIVNHGTISSAGHLSLNAGGTVTNTAVMTAAQNVNIASAIGAINNSGLISALTGNINIGSQTAANIALNNIGGTMQALNGAINFRDPGFAEKFNLSINGGDLLSRELNLNGGKGAVDVAVRNIGGITNIDACESHVLVSSGNLHLGDIKLTGDPTFYNDGSTGDDGDVIIGGDITVGETLTIAAKRDILTTGTTHRTVTAANGSRGFDINLIAGAEITVNGGGTASPTVGPGDDNGGTWVGTGQPLTTGQSITISGASSSGGSINFAGSGITLDSSGTDQDAPAGNVTLVAFADGDGNRGQVLFSPSSVIDATGGPDGSNGDITIIAGSDSTGTAIGLGGVLSSAGLASTGTLYLANVQPTISGSAASSITYGANGAVVGDGAFVKPTTSDRAGNIEFQSDILVSKSLEVVTGTGDIGTFTYTLTANVQHFRMGGSGSFTQEDGGSLNGSLIDITASGAGDIGSAAQPIAISLCCPCNPCTFAANTEGSAFVKNTNTPGQADPVLLASHAGGAFSFENTEGINIGGIVTAGTSLALKAGSTGDIVQSAGNAFLSSALIDLTTNGGSIGSRDLPVQVVSSSSAPIGGVKLSTNLQSGVGNAFIANAGERDLRLSDVAVRGDLVVTSYGIGICDPCTAGIRLSANVQAGMIEMDTRAVSGINDGDLSIGGFTLTAPVIHFRLGGSGSLTQTAAGLIRSNEIEIVGETGDIGTAEFRARTDCCQAGAGYTNSFRTGGNVYVSSTASPGVSVALLDSHAGGDFDFENAGGSGLTVGSVTTDSGSILLRTDKGAFTLAENSGILANNGTVMAP